MALQTLTLVHLEQATSSLIPPLAATTKLRLRLEKAPTIFPSFGPSPPPFNPVSATSPPLMPPMFVASLFSRTVSMPATSSSPHLPQKRSLLLSLPLGSSSVPPPPTLKSLLIGSPGTRGSKVSITQIFWQVLQSSVAVMAILAPLILKTSILVIVFHNKTNVLVHKLPFILAKEVTT